MRKFYINSVVLAFCVSVFAPAAWSEPGGGLTPGLYGPALNEKKETRNVGVSGASVPLDGRALQFRDMDENGLCQKLIFSDNYGNTDAFFSRSLAVGDLNDDGIEDLVVSQPFGTDIPTPARSKCGVVYVFYGPVSLSDTVLSSTADVVLLGESSGDQLGLHVRVADLNDDSVDDLIVVANWADGHFDITPETGDTYVFFGGAGALPALIDLQVTPAAPDITIHGPTGPRLYSPQAGGGIAVGDVNGDTVDDLLLFAPGGDRPDLTADACGVTYVIYGSSAIAAHFDLDTDYDVRIIGRDTEDSYWRETGCNGGGVCDYGYSHLATGDVNCDGIDDILMLFPGGDGPAGVRDQSGEVHIIFGSGSLLTDYDLLTDSDVSIYSPDTDDRSLFVISAEVSGDLCDDIIISSRWSNGLGNARVKSGELAIINGSITLPSSIDLLVAAPDVTIYAGEDNDRIEHVIVSDIDNNGINDLVFSAYRADGPNNVRTDCGEAYVFFRPDTLPAVVDLAIGPADIILFGGTEFELAGVLSSLATGDLNNDGQNDLVFGAPVGNDPVGGWPGKLSIVDGSSLLDSDTDSDAVSDGCDVCPGIDNAFDDDADCVINSTDNCPSHYNPLQEDFDGDDLGDACFLPVVTRPLTVVLREYTEPGAGPGSQTLGRRQDPTDPELNIFVIDPDGLVIGTDSLGVLSNTIGDSASYSNVAGEDSVQINDPKTGEYKAYVIPELGSNQAGRSYVIGIRTDGTVESIFGPSDSPVTGSSDTIAYNTVPLFEDTDGDGAIDGADNCATITNPGQEDVDGDGYGDACYTFSEYHPLTVVTRDGDNPENDPEVNLYITDPEGLVIGADSLDVVTNTIGIGAVYTQISGNDSVVIEPVKVGEYEVSVIPEANYTGATTSYIISVRTDGTVENVFGPSTTPTSGETDTLSHNATSYLAGDCDHTKSVNIADVTFMIARIFSGGPDCDPSEAGDADCSGSFNIADATFLLARIFSGGPPPGCY